MVSAIWPLTFFGPWFFGIDFFSSYIIFLGGRGLPKMPATSNTIGKFRYHIHFIFRNVYLTVTARIPMGNPDLNLYLSLASWLGGRSNETPHKHWQKWISMYLLDWFSSQPCLTLLQGFSSFLIPMEKKTISTQVCFTSATAWRVIWVSKWLGFTPIKKPQNGPFGRGPTILILRGLTNHSY